MNGKSRCTASRKGDDRKSCILEYVLSEGILDREFIILLSLFCPLPYKRSTGVKLGKKRNIKHFTAQPDFTIRIRNISAAEAVTAQQTFHLLIKVNTLNMNKIRKTTIGDGFDTIPSKIKFFQPPKTTKTGWIQLGEIIITKI